MALKIIDRLAQTRIGLHFLPRHLLIHPLLQLRHHSTRLDCNPLLFLLFLSLSLLLFYFLLPLFFLLLFLLLLLLLFILLYQLQDPHRSIIDVEDLSLGRLLLHPLIDRFQRIGHLTTPLRLHRLRQRHSAHLLRSRRSIRRRILCVPLDRDLSVRRLIPLLRPYSLRQGRLIDRPALSTSDHFLFVLRRLDRRLPRELNELVRPLPIDFPSTTRAWARAARD